MIEKDLEKINTLIDPRQKIAPFGGLWWMKPFMEELVVGTVLDRGYGIKKRLRKFSESGYFFGFVSVYQRGQEHIRYHQVAQ